MDKYSIILADNQRLLADALKSYMDSEENLKVVGLGINETDLYSLICKYKPSLLVVDPEISANPYSMITRILEINPEQKILVISTNTDKDHIYKLYSGGISGYVLKTSPVSILLKAVTVIFGGNKYFEPVLIPELYSSMDKAEEKKNRNSGVLTPREVDILKLVAQGLYNKEIAYNLNIKENTVKNHITRLFKKIGVSDRTQAAVYALKNGYVIMD